MKASGQVGVVVPRVEPLFPDIIRILSVAIRAAVVEMYHSVGIYFRSDRIGFVILGRMLVGVRMNDEGLKLGYFFFFIRRTLAV